MIVHFDLAKQKGTHLHRKKPVQNICTITSKEGLNMTHESLWTGKTSATEKCKSQQGKQVEGNIFLVIFRIGNKRKGIESRRV